MGLPVAFAAAATSQFLMARRLGFSWEENAVYNTASVVTAFIALHWLTNIADKFYEAEIGHPPSHGSYPEAKEKIQKIKKERNLREMSINLLASHALGWIVGSFVSTVFRYSPQHLGPALIINGTAMGVSALVLIAANPGCTSKLA